MSAQEKSLCQRKHFNHKWQQGKIGGLAFMILFAGIIGFSVFLSNGVLPDAPELPPTPSPDPSTVPQYTITTPTPDISRPVLQLLTLPGTTCSTKIAIDFLVDNSGSMAFSNGLPVAKVVDLKNGLLSFANSYPDTGVIGLQIFSFNYNPYLQELVPISFFQPVKQQFINAVNSLSPFGATYTRDAFTFVQGKLSTAMRDPRFRGYHFNLVFISDGIPEVGPQEYSSGNCYLKDPYANYQDRCFAVSQDPVSPPGPAPDIAQQIKSSGIHIYSIAYLDTGDQFFLASQEAMMKAIPNDPNDYYIAPTADKVKIILQEIIQKACQTAGGG